MNLSCLGSAGNAQAILRDLYALEKRYLPSLGWMAAPNACLATIETNPQGFRDKIIEPRTPGQYRIVITGGSFAWGLGASANAMTVAAQLERLLNQRVPTRHYRVMNGAFMNWTSRHEYIVLTEFFDVFDPDLVISLTGYNDLVALSKGIGIDELPEAKLLAGAVQDQLQPMGTLRALRKLVGTLGIWRLLVLLREARSAGSLPRQSYRYDERTGSRRVERTAQQYRSIADYLMGNGCSYLVALEPEIYSSKKALTVEEFDLKSRFLTLDRGLESALVRYRRELSNRLRVLAGEGMAFMELAGVFDDETDPVFIDYNHVCDLGNLLTARTLMEAILSPDAE